MESIVRDAVVDYVEKNRIISKQQHGFVNGRSCLTNLLEVMEAWTRDMDDGYGLDVIVRLLTRFLTRDFWIS